MGRPLEGMLVVSVEQAVAAPLCTCRLADAGARVIKVERPEGDFARGYDRAAHGQSSYFVWLNRGKESVVLDIKSPDDHDLLARLISRADVLVQNLMPSAMARAGFDLDELRRDHPRLVICSISGYGESGPYRDMKSYDMLIQAETGLASLTGPAQAPGRVGASVTDIAAGLNAYAAILEALIARQRTGDGALIRVSLFDATAEWMAVPLIHFDYGGRAPERMGLAHPSVAPYGLFATGDGKEILIAIQNEREWRRFCAEILGDAALADDPRFSDNNRRVAHRAEVDARVAAEFARHSRNALAERLKSAEIAFGNFNTIDDFSRHPHLRRIAVATPQGAVSAAPRPGHVRGRAAPRPGASSRRAHRGGARRVCAMSRAYLAAAIVLEICGTTSLKLSDGFTRVGPSGAVVLCYIA
ncbi:MAG TPA: SMR family transporter, partial [Stellaceae bacterium]|nr:SMR family transporter [Stellaceae bacterium]